MARKRRKQPDRPGRRPRPQPAPQPPSEAPLPDLPPLGEFDTPQSRAQELLDQAFDARSPRQREQLARQALAVCPDCADAYLLLSRTAATRRQMIELLEQAVAAAERSLGPERFRQYTGRFWGVLETRPYMCARLELALALWGDARRDEAVAHLQDMLRLNPNDNQGIRYTLTELLFYLDRRDDLDRLFEQYPEDTALLLWPRTLLAFRRGGDSPEALDLLRSARRANRHVVDYLLGREQVPREDPDGYSHGDESEAQIYCHHGLALWRETAGAIDWLRANDEQIRRRKAKAQPAKGPLGFIKNWLRQKLPQEQEVWQAATRMMPNPLHEDGESFRPWIVLVTSRDSGLVLSHTLQEDEPSPPVLWDTLVQAMQYPLAGKAHRPIELEVQPDERWESLREHLEEVGVRLVTAEELDEIAAVLASLTQHMGDDPRPPLLGVPGVTPELVAGFYAAAAEYFRQMPWKVPAYESAIQVECDRYSGGPWYAVVMGRSGVARGLAVYEDLAALTTMWDGSGDEENALEPSASSVIFGEAVDLPLADVEAAQEHGWEVARADAYPDVAYKERGRSFRRPLAWELTLLEGMLRAIPDFVRRRRQEDATPEEFTVQAGSGELKLVLSWVPEGPEWRER